MSNEVQFFSDNDILAAASLGLITLVKTTEFYTCSVIGKKPNKQEKILSYKVYISTYPLLKIYDYETGKFLSV